MERFKKALSLVLCFVMVFGLMPMNVFAADAAIDAAIFGSDVHGNEGVVSSGFSASETTASAEGEEAGGTNPANLLWVTIVDPAEPYTMYRYEQVSSITSGEKYVIVGGHHDYALQIGYNAKNQAYPVSVAVAVNGTEMTAEEELAQWQFNAVETGYYAYEPETSNYIRYRNAINFGNYQDTIWNVTNDNGFFQMSVPSGTITYWISHNGTGWQQASGSSDLRLYSYTGEETAYHTAGLYGRIAGETTYEVPCATSPYEVETLLLGGITAYTTTDTTTEGTEVNDSELTLSCTPVFQYDVPGDYTVSVSYNEVVLGTVTLTVAEDAPSTEIVIPDPETATGTGEITTTEEKEVYVLVSAPTAGKQYIIVNRNNAGSGYALKENTTTGSSITVNAAGNGISDPYIDTTDETIMWNAASGMTFQSENGGYYLRYNYGLAFSTQNSTNWTYSNNRLYYNYYNYRQYYLRYNNGWTTTESSDDATSVYFYEKQTIEVETTTTVSGTYSIAGEDVTVVVATDGSSTAELESTLTFTPTDGGSATDTDVSATATYEIYSDPNGVISGISGNTVAFSGSYGKALVKVSYETAFGTVSNYITVEASAPYYTIQLHKNEGGTLGEEITDHIALKGVKAGDTYSVWAVVKEHTSDNPEGVDMGELGDALTWSVTDTDIATIDEDTGVITFTGEKFGTFQVSVYYTGADGKLILDTIIISAEDTQYIVPGDGTDDFPEYPNEGAIRFDKNATAVGNFSESGMAKVELSMTGVPYSVDNSMDVVIMMDMSSSMSSSQVEAAQDAANAALEAIVKNEDGSFNDNRVAVYTFNGWSNSNYSSQIENIYGDTPNNNIKQLLSLQTYTGTSLVSAKNTIENADATGSGTNYAAALKQCYTTLKDNKEEGRAQYVIFLSDGMPTTGFAYVNDQGGKSLYTNSNLGDDGTAIVSTVAAKDEYYSRQMKNDGVSIYSVSLHISNNYGKTILANIAGTAEGDGSDAGYTNYVYHVASNENADKLSTIFKGIVNEIKQAATNVVVEDKIGSNYNVSFKLPNMNVTADDAGGMSEFYIQVLEYELNAEKERTGTPKVLENFTFDPNGALKSHTVDGVTCSDCSHVTPNPSGIIGIDGTYFEYTCAPAVDEDGEYLLDEMGDVITEEFLTWKADKLTTTELVLEYFVYLNNSAGFDTKDQVDAGTYNTNEYADITYDNYQGNRVKQEYPVPSMTWNGAQVTYVFYLVNNQGQPVNRAGRVIPFAEAVYVTDPVTENVVWYGDNSKTELSAEYLATKLVPDVYALYDPNAYYEIDVYQTEGVDTGSGVNYNHFIIEGSTTGLASYTTTKVFNTKSGTRYDVYGAYSNTPGSYVSANSGTEYEVEESEVTNMDYANTTVAFAVVWKPELVEDTVVVDYGLDVIIDVTTNDNMASGLVGVRTDAPTNIEVNKGTYTAAKAQSVDVKIGDMKIGTATVENLTSVRFSLDKDNGMEFSDAAKFYYESDVNYYKDNVLQTTSMYSSVTVIPATTIYYEDDFVDLTVWKVGENGAANTKTDEQWAVEGTTVGATQAQDRPGASKISEDLDADNNYGYDSAYANMSEFSMGSARKVTVNSKKFAEAKFTFYGTGFDLISLTSSTTGTITLAVYDENNEIVKSGLVDTYYGYTKVGEEWVITPNAENALYQVPVAEISGLPYGKYTAVVTAAYVSVFDHVAPGTDGSYDFYLDAVRIYDPANDGTDDQEIKDAYVADGEGWPSYIELRNVIIDAQNYKVKENEDGSVTVTGNDLKGAIFIDGVDKNYSIADYVAYGPNNEVYLAAGQSVAFQVSDVQIEDTDADGNTVMRSIGDRVQIGIKSANGTACNYSIQNVSEAGAFTNKKDFTVSTATDMYYDLTAWKDGIIVITNTGSGILSITNIKSTYTSNPNSTNTADAQDAFETYIYMTPEAAELTLNAMKPEPVNPFADVQKDHFFYESVLWAVENGITNGVNADHFGPFMYCNRAQVVTFLWRAAGSPEPVSNFNPFTDVKESDFFYKAVLWAVENGITNGMTATTFGANALCNRAQVVTFLWRANGSVVVGAENPFQDVPADAFYHDAVVWAVRSGITTGTSAATFDPNGTCMRAHVVTFLYRAEHLPELEVSGWNGEF